jgi:hypothetical protein
MQEGGDSNPKGANEHGSKQPGQNSERGGADKSESELAEKAYDFYHQHFGVALKSGTQDARSLEASRNPYGALTEVADKYEGHKSDSWHALKNLIRYQSSATPPEEISSYGSAGNTFEAQWFGKTDPSLITGDHPQQPADSIRLKWTPIVDNVAEPADSSSESIEEDVRFLAAEIEPAQTDVESVHADIKSGLPHIESPPADVHVLPNLQVDHADGESVSVTVKHGVKLNDNVVDLNSKLKSSHYQPAPLKINRPLSPQAYEELLIATARGQQSSGKSEPQEESAPPVEDEEISAQEVAEARSKFGTLNAFERLQKRTKAQSETKEEQSITGDMPDPVAATNDPNTETAESVASANDPNTEIPKPTIKTIEGAAVINQWCSTSTGDGLPSLEELNNIPTPSVLIHPPAPFSLSTPKLDQPTETDTAPDSVPQATRASWLKAASEYSASVIKAVTEQMKMLSTKPKKVTPESPEFKTAELSEVSSDKSDDISSS